MQVCTGVADSLFGCKQQAAGWQGGGGGGCVEYPVVMAHKQAMHRLEEEAVKHRLQEQLHDHSHEQHHRRHHTPLQRQQKQQQQEDEEQQQQEEGEETGSSLKRYSLNTTGHYQKSACIKSLLAPPCAAVCVCVCASMYCMFGMTIR